MKAKETAFIFIEFQNDFCSEGGKLYDLVKDEIARNHTIENAQKLLLGAREKGAFVIHCPFVLDADWTEKIQADGILHGILESRIFAPHTWGQAILEAMKPADYELTLGGKRSLSAFSHTDLETILHDANIRNIVICGFLTNVCVQATAFTAYDLGFTVRVAFDACGAASEEIQKFCETNAAPLAGGPATVETILDALESAEG